MSRGFILVKVQIRTRFHWTGGQEAAGVYLSGSHCVQTRTQQMNTRFKCENKNITGVNWCI